MLIATMARPFLVALGTVPLAIFAGVFIVVGWGSIEGNGYVCRSDCSLLSSRFPQHRAQHAVLIARLKDD